MSTLRYALLGLLAKESLTGYQLARTMHAPIGYFWQAGHSQIYPELDAMSRNGLVSARTIDGPGPRDTKQYSITHEGLRELTRWVAAPGRKETIRDEFNLRMWSAWLLDRVELAEVVRARRNACAERLHTYRELAKSYADSIPLSDPRFGEWVTLLDGIGSEEHRVSWCDVVLESLERVQPHTGD